MAYAKFDGNWFIIEGEIVEKHAILVDHFYFDGEYILPYSPLNPFTLTTLKHSRINHEDQRFFFQFEMIINILALSGSFEYLCYGSTASINICILTVRGLT